MSQALPDNAPTITDGGFLTVPWLKWVSWAHETLAAARQSGVTADRPTKLLWTGRVYYDATLGYPVWVHNGASSPAVWHNAAGASV